MLVCRSIDSPMDVNTKQLPDQEELLEEAGRFRKLLGKLNYLTVTRPNITFAVSVVSQFLTASRTAHLEAVMKILRNLKKALRRGLLYSDQKHIRVAGFSDTDWTRCHFDRSQPQDIVFLKRNLVS